MVTTSSKNFQTTEDIGHSGSPQRFKDLGRKGMAPLVDLLLRYKTDINPYVNAFDKALDGAINAFKEATEKSPNVDQKVDDAERAVQKWIQDVSHWFNGVKDRIKSENPRELLNYLEEQGKARPFVLFSSSYVIGLILGRLGRHVVNLKASHDEAESTLH
ncbi:MAG: hypothetical protein AB7I27_19715 [Bacteriovoracaceae bacterium]